MTAYRFVTLTCDRCGEVFEGSHPGVPATRELASREGWRYERRRDLCRNCFLKIRTLLPARWREETARNQQVPGGEQS